METLPLELLDIIIKNSGNLKLCRLVSSKIHNLINTSFYDLYIFYDNIFTYNKNLIKKIKICKVCK